MYHKFCENSTSFPGITYLIDFVDPARTVRNFLRRQKLISSFFNEIYTKLISLFSFGLI